MKYSIAIMAGGQSKRFGTDKTLSKLKDKYLIEYVIDETKKYSDDLFIVSKDIQKFKDIFTEINIFEDEFIQQCPLSGIVTALNKSKYERCIILPADTPFFKGEICNILNENLNDEYDIVMPRFKNKTYPLTAIYKTKLTTELKKNIIEGNFKIIDIIKTINVKYLDESYFSKIDSRFLSFLNINTRDDFDNAVKILKGS
jgi:molybdopterin-guanine dinucleotide biosynthesis protein A